VLGIGAELKLLGRALKATVGPRLGEILGVKDGGSDSLGCLPSGADVVG
jgi:hypothetical protein